MNQELVDYMKRLQRLLHLEGWQLTLFVDDSLTVDADAYLPFNDYRARIRVHGKQTIAEQKDSICHELVHLCFRDAMDTAALAMPDEDSPTYTMYSRFNERGTEQVARALCALMGD